MTFEELLNKIIADHCTAVTIEECGGISTTQSQSDKLGYDWINTFVGDVLVRQEYIPQENPTGTQDNPIIYTDGVPLINNAFYLKDGVLCVWMEEWVEW